VCGDRSAFTTYEDYAVPVDLRGIAGNLKGIGHGTVNLRTEVDGKVNVMKLSEVMYVPELPVNNSLLSVQRLTRNPLCLVKFQEGGCAISARRSAAAKPTLVARGERAGGLCQLVVAAPEHATLATAASDSKQRDKQRDTIMLWHRRLGHLGMRNIEVLAKHDMIKDFPLKPGGTAVVVGCVCEACELARHKRAPFKQSMVGARAKRVNELIHMDIAGPFAEQGEHGYRYFVTFTDDATRHTEVIFLKAKSELFAALKKYTKYAETKHPGNPCERIRCDNAGENLAKVVRDFMDEQGMTYELTTPETPEQNGVSERLNQTLGGIARAMLQQADLSKEYWPWALDTANYVYQIHPRKDMGTRKTPYELWTGKKPTIAHLRVFGCPCFVHIPAKLGKRDKLDRRSRKMIFIGYSKEHKAYRCIDPLTQQIIHSRDVTFDEDFVRNKEGGVTMSARDLRGCRYGCELPSVPGESCPSFKVIGPGNLKRARSDHSVDFIDDVSQRAGVYSRGVWAVGSTLFYQRTGETLACVRIVLSCMRVNSLLPTNR
jgi:hypothetical protein